MQVKCVFCQISSESLIMENKTMLAFYDRYPVTKTHCLVVPRRHCLDYFSLSKEEQIDLQELLHSLKDLLLAQDKTITGFNIGANCGEDAGQTIFHCHVHLIPRRAGDMQNPAGGVRGVIPEKQSYKCLFNASKRP